MTTELEKLEDLLTALAKILLDSLHVEAPEPCVDLREERHDRLRIADVAGQRDGVVTRYSRRHFERLEASTGENDREARLCERDRRCAADAAPRACDQRDPVHAPSSSST